MSAKSLSLRDFRANLASVMDRVESGERIIVTRRGKPVAEIAPPKRADPEWPDFAAIRAEMGDVKGEPMSRFVCRMREEELL